MSRVRRLIDRLIGGIDRRRLRELLETGGLSALSSRVEESGGSTPLAPTDGGGASPSG
jgi:hypothetical protein